MLKKTFLSSFFYFRNHFLTSKIVNLMKPKIYFPAILIFTVLLLSGFSAKSQNISDTIRIERNAIGIDYCQNDKVLNFKQLMKISANNQVAHKLMKNAYDLHVFSVAFSSVGSFMLGFSAGYAIGCTLIDNIVNMKLFLPFLCAGAGLTGIGISFEVWANNKARKGVAVFNNEIKNKNNTSFDVGFSTNGMVIRLIF